MALALANYTDLQATALSFMERTGETASSDAAPVWIQLAEARLNRELGPIETDQTFTATVGSRTLDISSLTIVEPLRLWYQPPRNSSACAFARSAMLSKRKSTVGTSPGATIRTS